MLKRGISWLGCPKRRRLWTVCVEARWREQSKTPTTLDRVNPRVYTHTRRATAYTVFARRCAELPRRFARLRTFCCLAFLLLLLCIDATEPTGSLIRKCLPSLEFAAAASIVLHRYPICIAHAIEVVGSVETADWVAPIAGWQALPVNAALSGLAAHVVHRGLPLPPLNVLLLRWPPWQHCYQPKMRSMIQWPWRLSRHLGRRMHSRR